MGTLYDASIVVFMAMALICTDSDHPHWSTVMGWISGIVTVVALTLMGSLLYISWATGTGEENTLTRYFFEYNTLWLSVQIVSLWFVVPVTWVCQRNNAIAVHWKQRNIHFMGGWRTLALRKALFVTTGGLLFSSQLFVSNAVAYFVNTLFSPERLIAFADYHHTLIFHPAYLFFTLTTGVGYMFVTKKMLRY